MVSAVSLVNGVQGGFVLFTVPGKGANPSVLTLYHLSRVTWPVVTRSTTRALPSTVSAAPAASHIRHLTKTAVKV